MKNLVNSFFLYISFKRDIDNFFKDNFFLYCRKQIKSTSYMKALLLVGLQGK
jgi:hypothetical protein